MNKYITTLLVAIVMSLGSVKAQEKFGNTLNLGLGIGYYGYYYTAPALAVNYEFDVFRNFTLAPFAAISTYRSHRYWGDYRYPYRDYYYRETVIPVGVKGSYYFDELLETNEKWDFYAALSLGVAFRTVHWEDGYYGDRHVRSYASPLFANLHIGTEYHLNQRAGLFLDLSTGFSTIGLGLHF